MTDYKTGMAETVPDRTMASGTPGKDQGQSAIARKTWELCNDIKSMAPNDEVYHYNKLQQQSILATKPWEKDPKYFQSVKISALALLKMVMHARSGDLLEVMGLLLGKVCGQTMVVMDAFALPVKGTETRVNAQAQAYEYMTAYMESAKNVGRLENAVGWYHSHPGYGCWLSGIDVSTQMLNQRYQEPFIAVVIDPVRTISAGKVCLGAFRTYPEGFAHHHVSQLQYQTIPLAKIEDFGIHCNQYYSLEVSYFKSNLDSKLLESLWTTFWINTLTSSHLLSNAVYTVERMFDLSEKLEETETALCHGEYMFDYLNEKRIENMMYRAAKDSSEVTVESINAVISQHIKNQLFNKSLGESLQQEEGTTKH